MDQAAVSHIAIFTIIEMTDSCLVMDTTDRTVKAFDNYRAAHDFVAAKLIEALSGE